MDPKGAIWGAAGDPETLKITKKSHEKRDLKSKLQKKRQKSDSEPPRPSKIVLSLERGAYFHECHLAPKNSKK